MWCARPARKSLILYDKIIYYIQTWSVCWVKSLVEKCTNVRRDSSSRVWMLAPTALVVKTYGNGHLALEVGDNGPLANKPSNSQNRSKLLRISGAVGVGQDCGFCVGQWKSVSSQYHLISWHVILHHVCHVFLAWNKHDDAWCTFSAFWLHSFILYRVPSLNEDDLGTNGAVTSSPTPLTSISFIQGARRGHWHSGLQQLIVAAMPTANNMHLVGKIHCLSSCVQDVTIIHWYICFCINIIQNSIMLKWIARNKAARSSFKKFERLVCLHCNAMCSRSM